MAFSPHQASCGRLHQPLSAHANQEANREESKTGARGPLPGLEAPRAERQTQRERQLAAGPGWTQAIPDLVFTDELGSPLEGTTVLFRFQRALRLAGIPRLRFHHLRHLRGSLLLASGADIATVAALVGHASIALTAGT